jgi:SPP1 family predicted phage head-tail adaptor
MRAGDLRRRVTIQTRDTAQDAYGGQVVTWTDYLTGVPADVQALSGRELFAAQTMVTEVTHLITIRYTSLLADPKAVAAMRVVYVNGSVTRYFNISAVTNIDERNKQIDLMCSEGLNNG